MYDIEADLKKYQEDMSLTYGNRKLFYTSLDGEWRVMEEDGTIIY